MSEVGAASPVRWRIDLDDYVHVVEPSPDRSLAVVGSLGGEAALVQTDNGATVVLANHEMGVLSAAWSADGTRFAVGGQDGMVRLYDRAGVMAATVECATWVTAMAWSSAAPVLAVGVGRHLLIVDDDGSVLDDFDDQPSTVTDIAWSPDGERVGVSAYGGIGWHDVVGERAGKRVRFDWHGSLLSLAISPDGKWACAGAQDGFVQSWKLWSGRELSMSGYPSKIERTVFDPQGRWLAVACRGQLSLWDFGGKGPEGTAPASVDAHDRQIDALAWNPSGTSIATGGDDRRTVVWGAPTKTGGTLKPTTAISAGAETSRLAWIDERSLLVGRADGGILRLAT
ncbi:MAG: hypothetical protein AAF567_24605 [Actinomycetota bacterium]